MHSKLASGFFDVAVRDSFPVTGVEFVSISLGTIYIPQVVDKPSWMLEEGEALHSPPGAFPVGALTRAQIWQGGK